VRIAITGASGFIGSHLCRGLRSLGHEPVAVVRATSKLDRLGECEEIEVIVADIGDQESLQHAFAGAEAVIHCAAIVDPYANPWEARSVNFISAFNVCHAAVDSGVSQLVQMSTAAVYSRDNRRGQPLREDQARIIQDPPVYDTYSINKAAAEQVVLDFGRGGRLRTTCLRPGAVYGPGDKVSGPIVAAIAAGRMAIIGGRDLHLPLIHVDDLVRATAAALDHQASGREYNLNGPTSITFAAYVEGLGAMMGSQARLPTLPLAVMRAAAWGSETWWNIRKHDGPPPLNRFNVELLAADFVLDIDRARAELRWSPLVELDAGLASVATWLRTAPPSAPALPPLF
jgi:nucleoside-diphosphate-sugar epimerase